MTRFAAAAMFCLALLAAPGAAVTADATAALPEIGKAPPFTLVDENGRPVSLADLKGRVVAVAFFFAGCSSICPLLTQKLVLVQDALGADFGSKVRFVSITLDPANDTPAVLNNYAATWHAKLSGWSFLTGPPDAVQKIVDRYGVYAARNRDGTIEHTALTSIVDPRGMLRVQYMGTRFDPDAFRRDLLSLVARP